MKCEYFPMKAIENNREPHQIGDRLGPAKAYGDGSDWPTDCLSA